MRAGYAHHAAFSNEMSGRPPHTSSQAPPSAPGVLSANKHPAEGLLAGRCQHAVSFAVVPDVGQPAFCPRSAWLALTQAHQQQLFGELPKVTNEHLRPVASRDEGTNFSSLSSGLLAGAKRLRAAADEHIPGTHDLQRANQQRQWSPLAGRRDGSAPSSQKANLQSLAFGLPSVRSLPPTGTFGLAPHLTLSAVHVDGASSSVATIQEHVATDRPATKPRRDNGNTKSINHIQAATTTTLPYPAPQQQQQWQPQHHSACLHREGSSAAPAAVLAQTATLFPGTCDSRLELRGCKNGDPRHTGSDSDSGDVSGLVASDKADQAIAEDREDSPGGNGRSGTICADGVGDAAQGYGFSGPCISGDACGCAAATAVPQPSAPWLPARPSDVAADGAAAALCGKGSGTPHHPISIACLTTTRGSDSAGRAAGGSAVPRPQANTSDDSKHRLPVAVQQQPRLCQPPEPILAQLGAALPPEVAVRLKKKIRIIQPISKTWEEETLFSAAGIATATAVVGNKRSSSGEPKNQAQAPSASQPAAAEAAPPSVGRGAGGAVNSSKSLPGPSARALPLAPIGYIPALEQAAATAAVAVGGAPSGPGPERSQAAGAAGRAPAAAPLFADMPLPAPYNCTTSALTVAGPSPPSKPGSDGRPSSPSLLPSRGSSGPSAAPSCLAASTQIHAAAVPQLSQPGWASRTFRAQVSSGTMPSAAAAAGNGGGCGLVSPGTADILSNTTTTAAAAAPAAGFPGSAPAQQQQRRVLQPLAQRHAGPQMQLSALPAASLGKVQGELTLMYQWYVANKTVYLEQAQRHLQRLAALTAAVEVAGVPAAEGGPSAAASVRAESAEAMRAFETALHIMRVCGDVEEQLQAPKKADAVTAPAAAGTAGTTSAAKAGAPAWVAPAAAAAPAVRLQSSAAAGVPAGRQSGPSTGPQLENAGGAAAMQPSSGSGPVFCEPVAPQVAGWAQGAGAALAVAAVLVGSVGCSGGEGHAPLRMPATAPGAGAALAAAAGHAGMVPQPPLQATATAAGRKGPMSGEAAAAAAAAGGRGHLGGSATAAAAAMMPYLVVAENHQAVVA